MLGKCNASVLPRLFVQFRSQPIWSMMYDADDDCNSNGDD